MPSWPASLEDLQFFPITMKPVERRLITTMDNGLKRRRRRVSNNPKLFTAHTFFTGAQLTTFINFYDTTLGGGVLSFDYENPRSDVIGTFVFQDKNPPWDFSLLVGAIDPDNRRYEGTLYLETI